MVIGGTEIVTSWLRGGSGGGGVSSINTLTGAITLAAGTGITLTPSGNTITIASFGTIAGSIAGTQVAFGVGANTIGGTNNFTYNSATGDITLTAPSGSERLTLVPSTGTGFQTRLLANTDGSYQILPAAAGIPTITGNAAGVLISASTTAATEIVLFGSTSGSAAVGVAAVAGSPNRINLPIITGTVGQVLTTDGGSPQQTSWTTPSGGVSLIANGTAALGTTSIATLSSAAVVTVAASGVLTTDSIIWAFNAAPSTGYSGIATSGLFVLAYVSAGNVNFLVINPTAGGIVPPAATLNWRVVR